MYSLVSVPYYDHLTQCYKKVVKLSHAPPSDSPLNAIIRRVGPIRLSTLFQFLIMNGFKIDTSSTKMMQASNVKLSNDLICFFS